MPDAPSAPKRHEIPTHLEVADTIVLHLTLRQVTILGGALICAFVLWRALSPIPPQLAPSARTGAGVATPFTTVLPTALGLPSPFPPEATPSPTPPTGDGRETPVPPPTQTIVPTSVAPPAGLRSATRSTAFTGAARGSVTGAATGPATGPAMRTVRVHRSVAVTGAPLLRPAETRLAHTASPTNAPSPTASAFASPVPSLAPSLAPSLPTAPTRLIPAHGGVVWPLRLVIVALPIGFGLLLAFATIRDRPLEVWALVALRYFALPRRLVWRPQRLTTQRADAWDGEESDNDPLIPLIPP